MAATTQARLLVRTFGMHERVPVCCPSLQRYPPNGGTHLVVAWARACLCVCECVCVWVCVCVCAGAGVRVRTVRPVARVKIQAPRCNNRLHNICQHDELPMFRSHNPPLSLSRWGLPTWARIPQVPFPAALAACIGCLGRSYPLGNQERTPHLAASKTNHAGGQQHCSS